MRKESLRTALTFTTLGLIALETSTLAFSRSSREKILERDNYQCRKCGATDHLEAAHVNHNKSKPNYDDPSNGRILCTSHHLEDHILREGRNGLSRKDNKGAIGLLRNRLRGQEWHKEHGYTVYQAGD